MTLKPKKITLVLGLLALAFLVIGGRLVQIGLNHQANSQDLIAYSSQQQGGSSITKARRGTIYDHEGQPIAMDATSYSLLAILKHTDENLVVKDYDLTANTLAPHLGMTVDQVLEILRNPDVSQTEFGTAGRNLSQETKDQIEAANLPGIIFTQQSVRQYINDVFASHLIGYAVFLENQAEDKADELIGQAPILKGQIGIEAAYNPILSGQINYQNQISQGQSQDFLSGTDLYLTLDARIQNTLEDTMTQVQNQYQPLEMGAYLVEIPSGKLLAASQRPSFNLNTRDGIDKEWRDYLLEEDFEPGSTIKILTLATAYDQEVYTPGETFQSGSVEIFDTTIKDHNLVGWGQISFEEGLIRSSNTAMVHLVDRIGVDNWIERLQAFGFGKTTNFGLANEIQGSLTFDNPVSKYMSAFGHAFAATPIQLMQAYAAIANQGQMLKVQVIQGQGSKADQYQAQNLGQIVTPQAAEYVLNLMVDTVALDYGTAKPFASDLVTVAAKTGTAEIANPQGTGYLTGPNDYLHSVVAFFPAENPRYMAYIFMQQPTTTNGMLGSQLLAQIFHPLLESILVDPTN